MATTMKFAGSASVADRIVEIRTLWHFKNHPFFRAFAEGKPFRIFSSTFATKFIPHSD